MDRKFFLTGLRLEFRRSLKKLPLLLLMVAVLLLLSILAGSIALMLLTNQRYDKIRLAVASMDGDARLTDLVRSLNDRPEVNELLLLVEGSPPETEDWVGQERVEGALIFPSGFFKDPAHSGAPRLIVGVSEQLETVILDKMADSGIRMLATFQGGVNLLESAVNETTGDELRIRSLTEKGTDHFIRWLMGYRQLFSRMMVNSTGYLTISQHYMLSALIFFFFLAMPLFYRDLSFIHEQGWLARLRSAGIRLRHYSMMKILGLAAAMAVPLSLSLTGLRLVDSSRAPFLFLPFAAGLVLTLLTIVLMAFLCCNAGGVVAATTISSVVASSFLVFSGGLVPSVLLPASIRALIPYSPFTWIRECLGAVYGIGGNPRSLQALSASVVILAVLSARRSSRIERTLSP